MATTATTNNGANKNAWDEKELGCLWQREKASTKEKYLTGVLSAEKLRKLLAGSAEDIQLVCFKNKNKNKDTHPDIRIYLSEKKPGTAPAPAARTTAPRAAAAPAPMPDAAELL